MIDRIIEFSIRRRWLLIFLGTALAVTGVAAVFHTPIDAIPDLSETQIIVHTEWPGHGPLEVQQSVTVPLSERLHGLEGIRTVRGSSDADLSWIHVIFDDGTPLPVARRRVEERLVDSKAALPAEAHSRLAPDAPATGQVFWYTVESQGHGLEELRSIQDHLIRDRLAAIPGVAEVASVGGFHSEYQVALHPLEVAGLRLSVDDIVHQIRAAPQSEITTDHLRHLPIRTPDGASVALSQLADVGRHPAVRYGAFEKDGNEVVGGVVLIRHGADPLRVIQRLRTAIDEMAGSLPAGVRIATAYDRTALIRGATTTVATALLEAMLTAGICIVVVTRHLRASLVTLLTLPLAVLSAFSALWLIRWSGWLDVQINMMSLAGITISIGVLVDSSIVMAENVMHRLHDQFGEQPVRGDVSDTVVDACRVVGRPIFFSVLIMLLSFLPVFAMEGLEGKMFRPLAITKSLALAAAAILAVTLVPALCALLIRGRMIAERQSRIVSSLIDVYRPILQFSLGQPLPLFLVLAATLLPGAAAFGDRRIYLGTVAVVVTGVWLAARSTWSRWLAIGSTIVASLILHSVISPLEREFLTPLDEGTAMDMPISIPGIAMGQAIDDLKARNMVLCRYPEVEMVMGKVGRADTPTDPAPLDMIETMINFRPREFWPRRRLAETAAQRDLAWIMDQLITRGAFSSLRDAATRQSLLNEAEPAILNEFHAVLREYAYQRNQDCIRDSAQACLLRLAQEVAGSSDAAVIATTASRVPVTVVARFADDWPGDMIPEIVRLMLAPRPTTLPADKVPPATASLPISAESLARCRRLVLAERRGVWQRHLRQLNSELRQRSAPTFVFLALRQLLSQGNLRDPVLRGEVTRLRGYQQPPTRGSRRTHHGTIEPAPPDVDPTPAFDACAADLARHLARQMVLQVSSRSEIAGFDGEMDAAVTMPGWTNVWTMPIQNRVDMLATGVNTTVGIRVLGKNLDAVVAAGERIAEVVRQVPGASGVVSDPVRGKRELIVNWSPDRAAALGLNPATVQAAVDAAQSGIIAVGSPDSSRTNVVRVQFDSTWRGDADQLKRLPLWSSTASSIVDLGQFAAVTRVEVPASMKSENGLSRNYVRLNVRDRDATEFVREARQAVTERVVLPAGVTLEWTGEFEQQLRAQRRLQVMLPTVLLVIFVVLWLTYQDLADATLMLLAAPGALAGGVLMQWFLGYKLSVTVAVGYIACLGMATSTGIIMLVYLRQAISDAGGLERLSLDELRTVVLNGAVCRLRPKLLTEVTTILGLAPMLWATGVGAEVIRPMAAPVLGGLLVADEVIDLLLPVLFFWVRRNRWKRLRQSTRISADSSVQNSYPRKDHSDALVSSTG